MTFIAYAELICQLLICTHITISAENKSSIWMLRKSASRSTQKHIWTLAFVKASHEQNNIRGIVRHVFARNIHCVMENLYLFNIADTPVKQEVPPLLGQNDNPAAETKCLADITPLALCAFLVIPHSKLTTMQMKKNRLFMRSGCCNESLFPKVTAARSHVNVNEVTTLQPS